MEGDKSRDRKSSEETEVIHVGYGNGRRQQHAGWREDGLDNSEEIEFSRLVHWFEGRRGKEGIKPDSQVSSLDV